MQRRRGVRQRAEGLDTSEKAITALERENWNVIWYLKLRCAVAKRAVLLACDDTVQIQEKMAHRSRQVKSERPSPTWGVEDMRSAGMAVSLAKRKQVKRRRAMYLRGRARGRRWRG